MSKPVQPRKQRSEIYTILGDTPGRRPSTALFDEDGPYDWDNFRTIFFETADIYEYAAAIKLVGSWDEWQRLKADSALFRRTIRHWVTELKAKLQSDSFLRILNLSSGTSPQALAAAKWIIEQTDEKRSQEKSPRRGRPSKSQIKQETRMLAKQESEEQAELERTKAAAINQ